MDIASIQSTYRRYAGHYDVVFGPILHQGRKLAVELANPAPWQHILEVGVGTGLSLPYYRLDSHVTGIDISPEMLAKARLRVERDGLHHVGELHVMDAEELAFETDSFDTVVAMYVASVVPHPLRMLDEMRRVCRPGGDIIIINHFASKHPLLRRCEDMLKPLSRTLGFRPDMELDSLPEYDNFRRVQVLNANLFGYWKLVHYRNGALQTVS